MTVTTAVAAPKAERHATPTREPSGDRLTRAATAIDGERQRLRIPGLALAIVEKDRVVLMRGFGVRNVEADEPVDSGTVFPIGSCTKAFTAMAAIICQEQGKLSLDDHPRRYLSWFRLRDPEADAIVTIRDMLSHRVGLRAYADLAAEPGVLTREEYLKAATAAKPVARLRERFGALVFETVIRESVRLAEAPSFHQPITTYAPDSAGAEDHRAAAREFVRRAKKGTSRA